SGNYFGNHAAAESGAAVPRVRCHQHVLAALRFELQFAAGAGDQALRRRIDGGGELYVVARADGCAERLPHAAEHIRYRGGVWTGAIRSAPHTYRRLGLSDSAVQASAWIPGRGAGRMGVERERDRRDGITADGNGRPVS